MLLTMGPKDFAPVSRTDNYMEV